MILKGNSIFNFNPLCAKKSLQSESDFMTAQYTPHPAVKGLIVLVISHQGTFYHFFVHLYAYF